MMRFWKWFDAVAALISLVLVVRSWWEAKSLDGIETGMIAIVLVQAGLRNALVAALQFR